MKTKLFLPFILLLIAAQDLPPIAITFPLPEDILRGEVTITGTTDDPNFPLCSIGFFVRLQPDRDLVQPPDILSARNGFCPRGLEYHLHQRR